MLAHKPLLIAGGGTVGDGGVILIHRKRSPFPYLGEGYSSLPSIHHRPMRRMLMRHEPSTV